MNRLLKLLLVLLSALLLAAVILSLSWRFQHDAPIMLYIGFLMDRLGYLPYRDIFDMNMPGTYLAYSLIGKIFGYTDIGIRCADLLILAAILLLNWLWMRKISKRVAWMGSVLWGLLYLGFGPHISLQREYLVLLPILSGCCLFSSLREKQIFRNLVVSFFFGIAATVKPHAAIGLLAFLFLDLIETWQTEKDLRRTASRFFRNSCLPVMIGVSLPVCIVGFYLLEKDIAQDFLDIAVNYWPLYTHLSGDHSTLTGFERAWYILQNWSHLGGLAVWLAPASIGGYISLQQRELKITQKNQMLILIGLTICYGIYPIFSGQFWTYHWLLFLFFVAQVASLCLIEQAGDLTTGRLLYPIVIIFFVIFLTLPSSSFIPGEYLPPLKEGRVDEIVTFLKPKLRAGDTVQPLDWTSGAIHSMLILRAKIATPYIYDFYFYHDISNEYIQDLRGKFVADLRRSRPRFIIDMVGEFKPWVNGPDTTREFDELQSLLDENYAVVLTGNGYLIYELRDSSKSR